MGIWMYWLIMYRHGYMDVAAHNVMVDKRWYHRLTNYTNKECDIPKQDTAITTVTK